MSLHHGILENSIKIDFPIKLLNWGNMPFCFKNHSLMLKVLYFMIKKLFSQSRGVSLKGSSMKIWNPEAATILCLLKKWQNGPGGEPWVTT